VENVTGLQINHYMGIGFGGLVSVVNQVGGVTMCLPKALHDYDSGANIPAGCHNLDGAQALAFVRDRHSFANEDLQRIEDQRAFLKALLDKATSPGVYLNPFVALPFGSAAASSISVDQGTHLYDLIQAALALRNPQTGTVPVADSNYETANAGDALLWNRSEALQLFNDLKNNQQVPADLLTGTTVG
jgi:anionic cell wall polymer biosynthesis LytR-Cps2A-Psr (LCP) family protein